jgi:amino acid adenylation domain-containing protein
MTDAAQRIARLSPEKRALLEKRLAESSASKSSRAPIEHGVGVKPVASFGQERLWILEQLEGGTAQYNVGFSLRLVGTLDAAALERALKAVVQRHETLQTRYIQAEGGGLQLEIRGVPEINLAVSDFSSFEQHMREKQLSAALHTEVNRPFVLDREPAIRATLYRMEEREHMLQMTLHHAASDGWSIGILFRDLTAFYNAALSGAAVQLPDLPVVFSDYARWQREQLAGPEGKRLISYWKDQLQGSSFALQLPTDRPRPAAQTSNGATRYYSMPGSIAVAINKFCLREQVTPFMATLAALYAVLARYSGQSDILIGSPIASRSRIETEDLVGFFTNTVLLRGRLDGDPTFRELLHQVRQTALEAYAHQELPLELLIDKINPERDLSRSAFFQVMLVFQNTPSYRLEFYGLDTSVHEVRTDTSKFDFTIELRPVGESIEASIEYNTDLFDSGTIDRLWGHLSSYLERAVAAPEQKAAAISLLTPAERQQLLVEWNATEREYPREASLTALLEAQVERTPDNVALVFENQQLTYRELNERANRLANYLRRIGVGPEDLVALYAERSLDMVVGLVGILKAGGAYLPIDTVYPKDRIGFMLEDAQVRVLLTQQPLLASLAELQARVVCLDTEWGVIERESPENLSLNAGPDNLAYVIYTSGSTGKPKGCQVTHYNVVRLMQATDPWFHFGESDVWTLFHSHAFDFSVWEIWGALLYGGRLVVVPYWVSRDPDLFLQLLREQRVTVLNQTPSAFRQLIQADEVAGNIDLSLRLVIFGGEALELQSLRPWFDKHGDQRPQLVNMYGITETTVHVTYRPLSFEDVRENRGSMIGRPIPDLRLYILDSQLQPTPIGVPGEICVGGAGVARGYLNRPELTKERFIDNPFSTQSGDRLYRSGDLARRLANGDIEYLGRIDQQVKIRGFRIELGEIEAALKKQLGIKQAVVIAREDTPGEKRLVAYYTASLLGESEQDTLSAERLRTHLSAILPEYMVPGAYVRLESLPLTPNGKLNRKMLPAPEAEAYTTRRYEPPQGEIETKLAAIWAEILKLDRVGRHDNFFEMGGDSLRAYRLFVKILAAFPECQPSLAILMKAPTVEQFASTLHGGQADWSCLVAVREGNKRPPFFCVPGAGGNVIGMRDFAMALPPDQPFYCLQARGLDGHSVPFSTVEETAGYYIEQIRRVQSHGPYYLGGYCYGGLVVFEMARCLQSQGETVNLVAMIDTYNFSYGLFLSKPKLIYLNSRFFLERILHHMRILGRMRPQEWGNYLSAHTRIFLSKARRVIQIAVGRAEGQFPSGDPPVEFQGLDGLSELGKVLIQVQDASISAARAFVPKPYDGHLLVFRVGQRDSDPYRDDALGWRPVALGGVTAYKVDGDHDYPDVVAIAEILDRELQEAQRAHLEGIQTQKGL